MFKKNWSILVIAGLLLGLVILNNLSMVVLRNENITKSDVLESTINLEVQSTAVTEDIEEERRIQIPSGSEAYDALPINNALLYVTADNLLQDRYSYSYKLFEHYLKNNELALIEDTLPFRLKLLAGDTNFIIYTKHYPDGTTILMSYHRPSEMHNEIKVWDGASPIISYYGGQLILSTSENFEVYSAQGSAIETHYELPEGSVLGATGIQNNTLLLYYEVDDLRYLDTYNIVNNRSAHMLVNLKIKEFKSSSNEFITVMDGSDETVIDVYSLPNLNHKRIRTGTLANDVTLYQNRQLALKNSADRIITLVDLRNNSVLSRQAYPPILDLWSFNQEQRLLFYKPSVTSFEEVFFTP